LVPKTVIMFKDNENNWNCIWGSCTFHQYFDGLNAQKTRVPFIAVKYISTAVQTVTRKYLWKIELWLGS
jgi:hypothetical protein